MQMYQGVLVKLLPDVLQAALPSSQTALDSAQSGKDSEWSAAVIAI
jgi:hypothetical protein